MTNKRVNEMMLGIGDVSGIFHATPCWVDRSDGRLTEQLQSWLVERRIAGWVEEASADRLTPGGRRSLRLRLGHAIAGLGERIAGQEATARMA